ncbi:ribbon-helix-helix protein, CopG family [Sphingobium sp. AN641]
MLKQVQHDACAEGAGRGALVRLALRKAAK